MEKIEFNGVQLEIDLLDADVLELYQNAINRITERITDKSEFEGMTEVQHMRQQCRAIDEFFDTIFGEGTAIKLFGGGNNLGKRLEAYGLTIECANKSQRVVRGLTDKYNPQRLNREQRRAQEFGKVRPMVRTLAAQPGRPPERTDLHTKGNLQLSPEQIAQIAAIVNSGTGA